MECKQELIRIALQSRRVINVLEEYELLASLFSVVSPEKHDEVIHDPIFDSSKSESCDVQDLYRASLNCDNVWTVRDGVDWLLFYIFYRRFGWDDWTRQTDHMHVFTPSTIQRLRPVSRGDEMRFKDRIVSVTTTFITWFETSPLRLASLKMVNSAIRLAKSAQNTRQHLVIHAIRWLTGKLGRTPSHSSINRRLSFMRHKLSTSSPNSPFLPEDATPESMYMAVKDLVFLCTTDTNYAIRRSAIPLIANLLDQLSLNTVVRLLEHTIEICNGQDLEGWETAEGNLNALGLLVKRAVPYTTCASWKQEDSETNRNVILQPASGVASILPLETYEAQILPKIQVLVFRLFDHTQPSVRIGAVSLFITCLKRCPHLMLEKALDEIMSELCVTTELDPLTLKDEPGPTLGTNATKSLLSLCQALLRHSCGVRLPPSTGDLQNSLIRIYLGHSDANVRMAASQVYVALVTNAFDNQNRVRYLLSKILENWSIRHDILIIPLHKTSSASDGKDTINNLPTINPGSLANAREARLNVFEQVARILVQRHYAVLVNVLVRGTGASGGRENESSIFEESGILEFERIRLSRSQHLSLKSSIPNSKRTPHYDSGCTIEPRRSVILEEGMVNITRSNSTGSPPSEILPSSPKPTTPTPNWLSSFSSRKENLNMLSVLDRFRISEEAEKQKQMDLQRSSVWRSEIARRLSVVARKASSKSNSLIGSPEVGQTRLRNLFISVLHASCENLVAEPRELRQSARRTFPEVARLLRWFDADLTVDFVYGNFSSPPTLMTYAALKILRSSLDEFTQYETLVISGEDSNTPDTGFSSACFECSYKDSQVLDVFPDGYFLNVTLIRQLFHPEKSNIWLRGCQNCLTGDGLPSFITLPAIDCILTALSLVHLLPQFSQAARYTESMKPPIAPQDDKPDSAQLAINPSSLVNGVRAVVTMISRFEVMLDDRLQLTTVNGEYRNIGPLRPFSLKRIENQCPKAFRRSALRSLVALFVRLIGGMEKILFHFLPPSANQKKPGPVIRRIAGNLLVPCLPQLATWPVALLPPSPIELPLTNSGPGELRLLAVRKLLRLVAAIVFALPVVGSSNSSGLFKDQELDGNSTGTLRQLDAITSSYVDVTSVVNSYFAQLEKILSQLVRACNPVPVCQSSSWWWFRALCEHVPRLMQSAPHANPVSLLRQLLGEVGTIRGKNILSGGHSEKSGKIVALWHRAILYARKEAAKAHPETKPKSSFANSWPTVGEILQMTACARQSGMLTEGESDKTKQSMVPKNGNASFDASSEDLNFVNLRNPAFDYMTDEEEELVLESAEPESSSSDECLLTSEKGVHKRSSIAQLTRQRKRYSTVHLKAQPIGTPPPLSDVVELVKRVWIHCEPVTVRTLQNSLSDAQLSLITGEQDQQLVRSNRN